MNDCLTLSIALIETVLRLYSKKPFLWHPLGGLVLLREIGDEGSKYAKLRLLTEPGSWKWKRNSGFGVAAGKIFLNTIVMCLSNSEGNGTVDKDEDGEENIRCIDLEIEIFEKLITIDLLSNHGKEKMVEHRLDPKHRRASDLKSGVALLELAVALREWRGLVPALILGSLSLYFLHIKMGRESKRLEKMTST